MHFNLFNVLQRFELMILVCLWNFVVNINVSSTESWHWEALQGFHLLLNYWWEIFKSEVFKEVLIVFLFVLILVGLLVNQILISHFLHRIFNVFGSEVITPIAMHEFRCYLDHFSCFGLYQGLEDWISIGIKVVRSPLLFDDLGNEVLIRKDGHPIYKMFMNQGISNYISLHFLELIYFFSI